MRCAIRGVLLAGAMLVSVASQAYVVPVTNASFETTSNAALSSDVDGKWWSGFTPAGRGADRRARGFRTHRCSPIPSPTGRRSHT